MTEYPDLARVHAIEIPTNVDDRGELTAMEIGAEVPFEIRRIYYMHRIRHPFERGSHAHRDTEQILVGVAGSLTVDVSDPFSTKTYRLDGPTRGLYIPAMIWTYLHDFTPQTVCIAAASTNYDRAKVIRSWDEYCQVCRSIQRDSGHLGARGHASITPI